MEISEGKVKGLTKTGADVNSRTGYRFTPLMGAALNGDVDSAEFLLKEGANVNDVDDHNQSALSHAVLDRQEACVNILLRAEADVNTRDKHGITPLLRSVIAGSPSCMKILIESGADLNIANHLGSTPLLKAVDFRNLDCVRLLLRCGAKINIDVATNCPNLQTEVPPSIDTGNSSFDEVYPDEITMVLLAAGQALTKVIPSWSPVPGRMTPQNKANLQNLCRAAIRKHLLHLDPHTHLFYKVPRLGLHTSLVEYLLYCNRVPGNQSAQPSLSV